jgi:hypothetical protein
MPHTRNRLIVAAIVAAGSLTLVPHASAQPARQPEPAVSAVQSPVMDIDARKTREDLLEVLQKHPPSVSRVLSADPSLMRNDAYLSSYPTLKAFLSQHPEIPQNAPFYFAGTAGFWNGEPRQPESQQLRMIQDFVEGGTVILVFAVVLSMTLWLIRTVLEQRRWNRLSKIQAEVHTKLMDRFSSNDELIAYVQTPSGRRFLESGPSPLQETTPSRSVGAPFSRILWSVQAGVVLAIAGLGGLFLSTRLEYEASQFFFVLGVLGLALGAGFVFSAVASYALSRKLGLFERPTTDHA